MKHFFVDTKPYLNSTVTTYDCDRKRGNLNAWGNSFPAEELPFGATLTVNSVPFNLSAKVERGHDNIEVLGQAIQIGDIGPARGVAFLGCGEMGDQYLTGRIISLKREPLSFSVLANGSMIPADRAVGGDGFTFTHLHYPGGYELDLMSAGVWCFQYRWEELLEVTQFEFDSNPLVHLFALTLLG